ncbi:cytochrome P450 [Nocardia sp. R16R-3T]
MAAIGFSEGPVYDALAGMTTSTEGSEHRQMRRAFQPWFIAENVEKFRSDIRASVDQWLRDNSSGTVDFANELGAELPSVVFTQLVGADPEYAPFISRMSGDILKFPSYDPTVHDTVEGAVLETLTWLEDLIDRKLSTPGADVTSALLQAEREGTITRNHTVRILMTLIIASVDSTRAQMACNLVALAKNKDQWRRLQQRPEAVPIAVPELYRYNPAVQTSSRYSERDLEFHGVHVDAYVPVFLGVFAANNDPAVYERPRELDVLAERARPSFSFGNGRHSCVGRMISTIEQEELLNGILEFWDDFDIAESEFYGAPFQQAPTTLRFAVAGRL